LTGASKVERVTCFRIPAALPLKTVSPVDTAVHSPKKRMLRNAHAKDSGPLCWVTPQRFPCSPSFRALTIFTPRLSRLKRTQHSSSATTNMQTTFAHVSPDNCATFYFLLASTLRQPSSQTFPQDPSPSCSSLTFRQPSSQTRLARSFLRETTAQPFRMTSTYFDLRETSVTTFTFSLTGSFC